MKKVESIAYSNQCEVRTFSWSSTLASAQDLLGVTGVHAFPLFMT